jgi:hypothetical protein
MPLHIFPRVPHLLRASERLWGRAARLLGAAEALLDAAAIPLYAWADREMHQKSADSARKQLDKRAWQATRGKRRTTRDER